jgi:hypothetical protein
VHRGLSRAERGYADTFQVGWRNGGWRRGGPEICLEAALALRKRDTGVDVVGWIN